jgi:hypothetical protein
MNKIKKAILPLYEYFQRFVGKRFPVRRSKKLFKKMTGYKCNLKGPQTLNEKLMFYKLNLYWNNGVVNDCADKYKVREFLSSCGLSNILNTLYGVWDKPEDIEWDKLSDRFVLKLNTGSGCNIVCKDKSTFDKDAAIKTMKKWFKMQYGYLTAEQGIYGKVKKRIIAEKYIDSHKLTPPDDFKFFCSYGEVKLCFVACDRYEGKTKFDFYYPNWEWIDVKNSHPNNGPIPKPKNYEKMFEYASILSKRFPLVRVDFYNVDGEIVFGELTFSHMGCVHPFTPDGFDHSFGALFPDVKDANKIL